MQNPPLKHLDAQVAEGVAPVFGMRRSLVCAVPTCGESTDIVHDKVPPKRSRRRGAERLPYLPRRPGQLCPDF